MMQPARRRFAIWISAALLALVAPAASAVEVRFEPVAEGVHAFVGELGARTASNEGLNANIGLVVTPAGAVLIDSGATWQGARQVHEAVRKVTSQPVRWVILLFTGDVVYVDRLLGVLPVSQTRSWLATFAEIERLTPLRIVPGHGRVTDLATAQADTRDYLRALRTHMKQAVEDGTDIGTAIKWFDARPFMRLQNAAELTPGNASRTYLELERE